MDTNSEPVGKYLTAEARRSRHDRERKYGHWHGKTVRKTLSQARTSADCVQNIDVQKYATAGPGCDQPRSGILSQLEIDLGEDWVENLPKNIKFGPELHEILSQYCIKEGTGIVKDGRRVPGVPYGRQRAVPARQVTYYQCEAVATVELTEEQKMNAEKKKFTDMIIYGPLKFQENYFETYRQGMSRGPGVKKGDLPWKCYYNEEYHQWYVDQFYLQENESAQQYVKRRNWPIFSSTAQHVKLDSIDVPVHRTSTEAEARGKMLLGRVVTASTIDGKKSKNRKGGSAPWSFRNDDFFDAGADNAQKGFLEIDFGKTVRVNHVATQGQPPKLRDFNRFPKSYTKSNRARQLVSEKFKVILQSDIVNEGFDNWVTAYDVYGRCEKTMFQTKTDWFLIGSFSGNSDMFTEVSHELVVPRDVRYLRFQPTAHHGKYCRMRVAVYGEKLDKDGNVEGPAKSSNDGSPTRKENELDAEIRDNDSETGIREGLITFTVQGASENLGKGRRPCQYALPKSNGVGSSRREEEGDQLKQREDHLKEGLEIILEDENDLLNDEWNAYWEDVAEMHQEIKRNEEYMKEEINPFPKPVQMNDVIQNAFLKPKLSKNQMKKQKRISRQNSSALSMTSWNVINERTISEAEKSWIPLERNSTSESDTSSWAFIGSSHHDDN